MQLKHSYLGEILSYYLNGSSCQEMQFFGDFRNNSSKAGSTFHYNFRDGKCTVGAVVFVLFGVLAERLEVTVSYMHSI